MYLFIKDLFIVFKFNQINILIVKKIPNIPTPQIIEIKGCTPAIKVNLFTNLHKYKKLFIFDYDFLNSNVCIIKESSMWFKFCYIFLVSSVSII